ncbi:sugar phosphate nucleotidyltransferase [Candidatus Pelagibacter sp.]|nr:sugar phosphate nucleotidyltransferase [Candidatus Pelagibacter sp.]|tara:strand:- start:3885 stop:4937 length:1053 start_codon:yes stop_codon:yes gene_type:complete
MKKIIIKEKANITLALKKLKISGSRCLIVLNKSKQVLGTLSDGDLRKKIISTGNTKGTIKDIYNKKPHIISQKQIRTHTKKIIQLFVKEKLSLIPVIDDKKKIFIKALYYQDLIKVKKNKIKKIDCPVIIMAGGRGTRLKPFTEILPKPLMPLKNKTVIEHIILNFVKQGFKKFIITINYKSEILKAYFKELNLKYDIKFIEEKKELGTVGSVRLIRNLNSNFILTNCDNLYKFNLKKLHTQHLTNSNDLTVVVSGKKISVPYGVCEIKSGNNLKSINEKPTFNFSINTGLYMLNKKIVKHIPKHKKFGIDDLLHILIKDNYKIKTFKISDKQWFDTGQWDQFKKTINNF